MRKTTVLASLTLALALTTSVGCATEQFHLAPVRNGKPLLQSDATYEVPGDAALGTVQIRAQEVPGETATIRIEMTVSNQSDDKPWTVLPGSQKVVFGDHDEISPELREGPLTPPLVIAHGESKDIYLRYRLPHSGSLAFHWTLEAGARQVREATVFARLKGDGDPFSTTPESAATCSLGWSYEPFPYNLGCGAGDL